MNVLGRFRRNYGAEPLHLLAALASFALVAYAFVRIFQRPETVGWLVWLGAAVVAHDFVLFWLYRGLNRIASRSARPVDADRRRLSALNHVRVPVFLSGLLFLVWFPLILSLAPASYRSATDLLPEPYLERWLLITAALFLGSALAYAVRVRRLAAAAPEADR